MHKETNRPTKTEKEAGENRKIVKWKWRRIAVESQAVQAVITAFVSSLAPNHLPESHVNSSYLTCPEH
jgi:hypothetical protein